MKKGRRPGRDQAGGKGKKGLQGPGGAGSNRTAVKPKSEGGVRHHKKKPRRGGGKPARRLTAKCMILKKE